MERFPGLAEDTVAPTPEEEVLHSAALTLTVSGQPSSGQVFTYVFDRTLALPEGSTNSEAACLVGPVDAVEVAVAVDGNPLGTINWDAAATIGAFNLAATTFAAGQVLTFTFPAVVDVDWADIAITLQLSREDNPGESLTPVASVFGRTGAVVAADGDYNTDLITNTSGQPGGSLTEALDSLQPVFSGVLLTKNAETIAEGADTVLGWENETYDIGDFHVGSDPEIIIPADMGGYYEFYGTLALDHASGGLGDYGIKLVKNGAVTLMVVTGSDYGIDNVRGFSWRAGPYLLVPTDEITVVFRHEIVGGIDLSGAPKSEFGCRLAGA